jgi:hypothetical protein
MDSLLTAFLVFLCVFGGALVGMYIRRLLPEEHLRDDTKAVVGLSMGLIGTLTALLLAMVTSSAKETFDFEGNQLRQTAINILMVDRVLADYGPETRDIREALRRGIERHMTLISSDAKSSLPVLPPTVDGAPYRIMTLVRQLAPQNELQHDLKSQALQLMGEILKARWVLAEETTATIPAPFLVIVVCWLTLIFSSFGLFAPRNATATAALLVCATSVAGSIFLILELNTPFSGLMRVSVEPLRFALTQLGN